jgi:protein-S-isoprenylcysteine O-methyltransferase Ste14
LTFFGLIALPLVVYYLWLCVTFYDGSLVWPASLDQPRNWLSRFPMPTLRAAAIYGGWVLLQVVLQIAAPGKVCEGTPLADGSRLKYKLNGWFSFCITLAVVFLAVWAGWLAPTLAYDHFGALLTTVNLAAFGFSLVLYLTGPTHAGQGRGNFFYDYFMGVSLNPRIGAFDLKFFCESRPGLIAWVVINFSLAAKQYELHGTVTTPMILVLAFHFLYIADYFWHEEAILTTWDIKHEKFGWMLCWGDLVWVPFTYTLQAHYLVSHTHELPVWGTLAIVVLNLVGYYLFRSSNLQKHHFRKDPEALIWGRKPTYLETSSGTRLLTSGWWGVARHINYLGDLLMGLAWCLPCLFAHVLPYFYIIYFLILLLHRERRDHALCLRKYGADWQKYCAQVRWRILPGVY